MKTFFKILVSTFLLFNLANAEPLPAQFYVNSFSASVGDSVEFILKVSPEPSKPVYTVISNLEYNKNLLTFSKTDYQSGWVVVSPEEITDVNNGVIKRAAGYPTGLKTTSTFIKYSFIAKAPGKAVVNIIGGSAYDAESKDYGLQNKSITVNISAKAKPEPKEEQKKESKITQEITLVFAGTIATAQNQDYGFKINHTLSESATTTGKTLITILNNQNTSVYTQEKTFSEISNFDLDFTIPANTLMPGNYTLVASSTYDNQKGPTFLQKDFGVVAPIEKIVKEEKIVEIIPLWYWALLLFVLLCLLVSLFYHKSKNFRQFLRDF